MGIGALAAWAALALAALSLAVVAGLLAIRVVSDRVERRRLAVRTPVWRLVLTMTTGEDEEVTEAQAALERLDRAAVQVVEPDAFGLLPKLRGEAQQRLRHLLRHWGSAVRAEALVGSWSAVRRCRGLYRLGMLADPATLPLVAARLRDRDFAVRRVAVQALGSIGDPSVIPAMVDLVVREPALRRDLLAAVDRIGLASGAMLEAELVGALEGGALASAAAGGDLARRRAQLAAEGLGLVDATSAAPTLVRSYRALDHVPLAVACLDALGRLGAPAGLPALQDALGHPAAEVRRSAATALGLVGGPGSVESLVPILEDPVVEVARAAAQALRRGGDPGLEVLRRSAAPVARETVALSELTATP
jgi:HEAT repeat protein